MLGYAIEAEIEPNLVVWAVRVVRAFRVAKKVASMSNFTEHI